MIKKFIAIFASIMPNIIKIQLYRLMGYKIGKKVTIKPFTLIIANEVKIGDNVVIGALNLFKMNKLEIGSNSIIRSLNMIIGPKSLIMGKRVQIVGPFTFMNLAEDIILGDRCGIGSHSIFYTHGVHLPYTEGYPRKFGKISLGKNVWSPAHVVFLPGVNIGDNSIIAANSLVNNSFPENSFIAGSPAKIISKASKLKMNMTPERLNQRMNQILSEFKEDKFLEDAKIKLKKDIMEIRKGKESFLIKLYFNEKAEKGKVSNYNEIIVFGENLPSTNNKKISLFDLKKRKMTIRGKFAEAFLEHLGRYGEYFN